MTAFQPHGVVLVVAEADGTIRSVTTSAAEVAGRAGTGLVGLPLAELLDQASAAAATGDWSADDPGWHRVALADGSRAKLHLFRAAPGLLGIDLLVLGSLPAGSDAEAVERVARWSERVLTAPDLRSLMQVATATATELTGFDGAWACRIETDGHGVVVAADVTDATDVVGQSVLATDMPPDQPRLGPRQLPFFVADLAAAPTELQPAAEPGWELSGSALLRRYEPYLERLAEIGVRSTFSVPVMVGGELWGRLIAHHPAPMHVPAATQAELRLLGEATGTHLRELTMLADAQRRLELSRYSRRLLRRIVQGGDVFEGLVAEPAALLGLGGAASALVVVGDHPQAVGEALPPGAQAGLLDFARGRLTAPGAPDVIAVAQSSELAGIGHGVAGVLAVRLSDDAANLILWTRPPDERLVSWVDHQVVGDEPPGVLFGDIHERVAAAGGGSRPWDAAELQAVGDLRGALANVAMARMPQVEQRNADLIRSNEEFDAFAHTAAHDLKQPIRGVRQFTELLLEDLADRLTDAERGDFDTILRLTGRMDGLLNDLMRYAQVGAVVPVPEPVDLARAVAEATELLAPELQQAVRADVRADATFAADPSGLRQLLLNLLGNAAKYSGGAAQVRVELTTLGAVGRQTPPPATLAEHPASTPVLTVADEGPGVPPARREEIFGLFERGQAAGATGTAGTGVGLAVCRRIARRHGGDIWAGEATGGGALFAVVLQAAS